MAIRIKNNSQIERIDKAGDIVAGCFEIIKPYIKDGVTTKDLEKVIADYIKKCKSIKYIVTIGKFYAQFFNLFT